MNKYFLILLTLFFACRDSQQNGGDSNFSEMIRVNQIGYYPNAPKLAVALNREATNFQVTSPDLQKTVYSGTLSGPHSSSFSDKTTWWADFSEFKTPGEYVILIEGVGHSFPFEIQDEVFTPVAEAALKSYYFQRISTGLPEEYAGKWSRKSGHPDLSVEIHPSAASSERPAGTTIKAPGGWYDAGDYGKYIVNSGISTATLLSAYEDFGAYFDTLKVNIPESSNQVPDLLDETLWNLRWMLAMQDPNDGGVYHKLTTAGFTGMIMPAETSGTRYVIQKSTAATLDFAAVMAQAARIYDDFATYYPGLADSCLAASQKAWNWAQENPDQLYRQNEMNEKYDPDITTGAYGDNNVEDEFSWAASELLVTTGDQNYFQHINFIPPESFKVPSWGQVHLLGFYSLLRYQEQIPAISQKSLSELSQNLLTFAEKLIQDVDQQAFKTVMEPDQRNFVWGSNAVAVNQGIALIQAYNLSKDPRFLNYALANLDYLLGKNATGYSYLTGYGDKTPMFIHHRPSEADQVEDPVPGLLAGGPNPAQQDQESYPSDVPDESYVDIVGSYASNEIAINWNAPFVYLTGALEALQYEVGWSER